MASFVISVHAAERWIERIDPAATISEARAAIRSHSRAIEAALKVGCRCIRLGCGCRIVLDPRDGEVITILPAQPKIRSIQRSGTALDFRASRGFSVKEQEQ